MKVPRPGPNGDPIRDFYTRALQRLLEDSKRADERWKEWREEWREECLMSRRQHAENTENFRQVNTAIQANTAAIREGAALTAAALREIIAELRSLRGPPRPSGNGFTPAPS